MYNPRTQFIPTRFNITELSFMKNHKNSSTSTKNIITKCVELKVQ